VRFFFEFFVAVVKSNILFKRLLAFISPPTMWMAHNFLRMILTMALMVIFVNIGEIDFDGLPAWTNGGGGVVVWTWLNLVVWSKVSAKLFV